MLRSGEIFADYVIERELGRGGMGSVFLAKHPRLPRRTALKVLNRELFSDAESRARFDREADLFARLDHPNIVAIYDRGAVGAQLWISMQYVEGRDAASVPGQEMPPERAVRIVAEVAEALDHAHGRGVLHRDVKPANILLEQSANGRPERVLLTDFGIARLRDDAGHLTRTGTFTATLAYASPEQLSGEPLDPRADQYSLACTLFRLLTGSGPFEADHPAVVMQGHLYDTPPSLSAIRPDLPPAVDRVLARAMAKRPQDRFGTCADFAAAARRALVERREPETTVTAPLNTPGGTTRHPFAGDPTVGARPQAAAASAPPAAPARSRRRLFAGIGAAAVVVVLAVAGFLYVNDVFGKGEQTSAGDHEAIWRAFPKMVPVDTKRKEGFSAARCESFEPAARPPDDDDGLNFGKWTAQWECESGGDYKDPAFRFYAYKSSADVRAVVALLDSGKRFVESNHGRSYTNYRVKSYWGEAIVTVFLDTDDRAAFLMYSRPKSSTERQDVVAWWKTTTLD
ncbi:serine/threonine-protein kinase [Nocardia mexicana]|uniref:non-specific serine/threonine protein kinase n=1 Tax=Nocardia mexicana TaxID=279262 RepID=A0A370H8G7_9NOCA|nr:serine/threonine-protein kinase [Nocardia mexicana]RDI52957.1 serine/threonine-protein kinase [Nocardia mexicana]